MAWLDECHDERAPKLLPRFRAARVCGSEEKTPAHANRTPLMPDLCDSTVQSVLFCS